MPRTSRLLPSKRIKCVPKPCKPAASERQMPNRRSGSKLAYGLLNTWRPEAWDDSALRYTLLLKYEYFDSTAIGEMLIHGS